MPEENNQGAPQVSDTGSGVLVGADPAQPRKAADWEQSQRRPDQDVSQPVQVVAAAPTQRVFTVEELEEARRQEKDKLYPRIQGLEEQLKAVLTEREAEKAEKQRLAEEAAEATRLREEQEMDVRSLLDKREKEWQAQFAAAEAAREQDRAVYEQERRLTELENYRRARIEQEAEWIIPQLRDFVHGNTIEEIDASIEAVKERSESIFQDIAQSTRQQPRGAAPTAPPVGPMEQLPTYESLTPQDIAGMDMDTYKKYRDQLLAATNPARRR
jgi:hypothetical protein